MKKIVFIFFIMLCLGCKSNNFAVTEVNKYLNSFQNLDKSVKDEIDHIISDNEEFNDNNKKIYKDILYRQYKSLKYDVLREEYDGDNALITVNINVYDLKKAEEEAINYLTDHLSDFYDENNIFDNNKYISYKLDLMKNTESRVDYEIVFFLTNKKGKWILEQPTDNDLEKIHGIYEEI